MSCKWHLQINVCVCPPTALHRSPDPLPALHVSAVRQRACFKTLSRLPMHCLACLSDMKEVLSLWICPSSGVHLPSCSARTSPVPQELCCTLVLWNALFIDIF